MEAGNYKDALNLLDKSLSMNKQLQGNEHFSCCSIYQIMSKVYIKQKEFETALKFLQKIEKITEDNIGDDMEPLGNIYLQIAKVFAKKREETSAIQYQEKAQSLFEQIEKYAGTDFMAGIATQLSTWQE